MELASLAVLLSAALTVAVAFFSKKYYGLKSRVEVLAELLQTASQAVKDDQITQEEPKKITDLANRLLEKG